jgi:DNA polymerase-3 subunit delta
MRRARRLGTPLSESLAEHVADLVGPELGPLADALERLSLYVGPGRAIDEAAVSAVVARVKHASVWELVDALTERRTDRAIRLVADLEIGRGDGNAIVGAIASNVRKLARLEAALARGVPPEQAGQEAQLIPFKIRSAVAAVRAMRPGTIERWLGLLAEADRDLKGGSRRSDRARVETLVLDMGR